MSQNDVRDPKKDRRDERAERDDFWDIDRLIPERSALRPPVRRSRSAPSAVEIEVPARPAASPATPADRPVGNAPLTQGVRPASPVSRPSPRSAQATAQPTAPVVHYVPPHTEDQGPSPILSYRPDGVLIHKVDVFEWASNFHYFDQFVKDAAEFAVRPAPAEAKRESYFSYFPQYVQMNRRQTEWYLWWRERVRGGTFPETDYAYILLYIFELINLDADRPEDARRHADLLSAVWMAYRRAYPQLDHYMCEWLCDYCLIHALPAPLDILAPALDDIIGMSRLKEFYLVSVILPEGAVSEGSMSGRDRRNLVTARILLRHCCQYDYRKSKFANGEHKALFDKTIPAAVAATLPLLFGGEGQAPAITMQDSTLTRDAYTGALCSYRHKRKIVVAYTSFSRSHDLRFLIGDMVKHVENRLRTWIGVRSKLSVMSLPLPLRDALDAYLAPLTPKKSAPPTKKKEEERPAYEALYDLPEKELSLSDAADIEARSWETTRILTEAFGGEGEEPLPPEPVPQDPSSEPPCAVSGVEETTVEKPTVADAALSPLAAALSDYLPFIRAALCGDRAAERAYAAAAHKMPDAVADEINTITAECEIYDMVMEDDGSGLYVVIDDYRDILQSI